MEEGIDDTLRYGDLHQLQSVIIEFSYGIEELDPLHELEDELIGIVEKEGVGLHDGHEVAMDSSHGFLFLYGPNAEILFKTIKPTLETRTWMQGAVAHLRFGPTGGEEVPEISVYV
jgi:hypothetical protein